MAKDKSNNFIKIANYADALKAVRTLNSNNNNIFFPKLL